MAQRVLRRYIRSTLKSTQAEMPVEQEDPSSNDPGPIPPETSQPILTSSHVPGPTPPETSHPILTSEDPETQAPLPELPHEVVGPTSRPPEVDWMASDEDLEE